MVCVEADTVGVFWRKDSIIIPFSHFILAPSFSWKTFLCLCLAGGLQLLRQATHSCGLCTNCALCLQHCSPRHLRVSLLILCWFLPKHFCMEGLSMITLSKQLLHCPTRSLVSLRSIHHHLTHHIFILLFVCLCPPDYNSIKVGIFPPDSLPVL